VCTPHGLPVASALTGANAVDREVLAELLAAEPDLVARRPRQVLVADKNYDGREFKDGLAELGVWLLRPARKGEPQRPGIDHLAQGHPFHRARWLEVWQAHHAKRVEQPDQAGEDRHEQCHL
jgi:Transposase DDE domain